MKCIEDEIPFELPEGWQWSRVASFASIITDGEHIFINKTGSSALAKAGTGDVLTGMIAGLMAQKLKPFDAAILGTYLHGLSGNLAEKDLTKYSVLATNVIEYLPFAIKEIMVEE